MKEHLSKWKDEAERVQDEAEALQILAATVDQALEQTKMWKNISGLLMDENKNLHREVEDLNKRMALAFLVKETEHRERGVSLKLPEAEKESDKWKAKVQQLLVDIAKLQAQLLESTRKVAHLEVELEKSRQQEKNIALDFEKVVGEANIREKENDSLLNLNKGIQRQLQDSTEKISELESALKESHQREEELSSALEKAMEQTRMQKKETDSLLKRKRALSQQAQDSNKKIADLNLALGKLKQREQELSSSLNREVEKTKIWEKERASLFKTIETLQCQLQEEMGKEKELYSTLKQLQQREKELSSALEKALQQKINLEKWFSSFLEANKTLRKQQQELTSKIEEHNLALENSQQQEQRRSSALQKKVWRNFWEIDDEELSETESGVAEDDFYDAQYDEDYSSSYDPDGELSGGDSQNEQYGPNEVTRDNFAANNDDVHHEIPEYDTDEYSSVDDDEEFKYEQYDTDQSHYVRVSNFMDKNRQSFHSDRITVRPTQHNHDCFQIARKMKFATLVVTLAIMSSALGKGRGMLGFDTGCGENEVYDNCFNGCEPTCNSPVVACILLCGPGGCTCQGGYLRNKNGLCVPKEFCDGDIKSKPEKRALS
ncbi:unnamed protein product [Cylicocyclus nassatus]|uniref:TIL domain-containing protein n=1 Tax=Cylicocyclus nassatus TaxID=53992 RepID=A0AA36GG73_CYLNA|nr:unnamed protein product [Cylicocyclus nassatus]